MPDTENTLLTIAVMASIVYFTRACGYFIGLQFRHIGGLRPVLEALPGCAIMAILVPSVRRGDPMDVLALICVLGLMWKTNNVVLATVVGLVILIFGSHIVDGVSAVHLPEMSNPVPVVSRLVRNDLPPHLQTKQSCSGPPNKGDAANNNRRLHDSSTRTGQHQGKIIHVELSMHCLIEEIHHPPYHDQR